MLESIDGLRMIGTAEHKAAVCSFVIQGVHPLDLGTLRPIGQWQYVPDTIALNR